MEDFRIIELYFARDEQAIAETDLKYGSLCRKIAANILDIREDAEECVNDTWYAAWNRIPPEEPRSLQAFLGRITRNLSISRFRTNRAKKRYSGMEVLLSELSDCIPDKSSQVEQIVEAKLLGKKISRWLDGLPTEDRVLFVRRYWYGDTVQELSEKCGTFPAAVSRKLFRLREKLRKALLEEGIMI